jgi:hypothetical protein
VRYCLGVGRGDIIGHWLRNHCWENGGGVGRRFAAWKWLIRCASILQPAKMKFTAFDFLKVVSFTTPLGMGLAVGGKLGGSGIVVGAAVGLTVGFGMFFATCSAVEHFAKRIERMPGGRAAERCAIALLLGGFVCVFATSWAAAFVTQCVVRCIAP